MRTDRLTDMTKLTVAFRNPANAPKKSTKNLRKNQMQEDEILYLLRHVQNFT